LACICSFCEASSLAEEEHGISQQTSGQSAMPMEENTEDGTRKSSKRNESLGNGTQNLRLSAELP